DRVARPGLPRRGQSLDAPGSVPRPPSGLLRAA
ncbi:MAG: hypothetical protein AVDCRST_MAG04-116, partial [uncultured Acetobacteraceae bacterium]